MRTKWLTNIRKSESEEFIKFAHGRNLIIGDPIATDCLSVQDLKTGICPYVGIYEVIEE